MLNSNPGLIRANANAFMETPVVQRVLPLGAYFGSMWNYYTQSTTTDPVPCCVYETDRDGRPVAGIVAGTLDRSLNYFGSPAVLEFSETGSTPSLQRGKIVAREMLRMREAHGTDLNVRLVTNSAQLTGADQAFLQAGATAGIAYVGEVDLKQDEGDIWESLRKNVRSQIKIGRTSMRLLRASDLDDPSEAFELYRTLHREVAGRVTRPAESWQVMLSRVLQGRADLQIAFIESRAVAATLVTHFGDIAVYASGAYVKDLGNFPVSYWPVFASILAARELGCTRYILGASFPPSSSDTGAPSYGKAQGIARFKSKFATSIITQRTYCMSRPDVFALNAAGSMPSRRARHG